MKRCIILLAFAAVALATAQPQGTAVCTVNKGGPLHALWLTKGASQTPQTIFRSLRGASLMCGQETRNPNILLRLTDPEYSIGHNDLVVRQGTESITVVGTLAGTFTRPVIYGALGKAARPHNLTLIGLEFNFDNITDGDCSMGSAKNYLISDCTIVAKKGKCKTPMFEAYGDFNIYVQNCTFVGPTDVVVVNTHENHTGVVQVIHNTFDAREGENPVLLGGKRSEN